jgi:endonuclease YncB( thermonuclease family)
VIWRCQGSVVKVRDGDTFLANLDLGWHHWQMAPSKGTGYGVVRVLDLWCPELHEPGGQEAKAYAVSLLPFSGEFVTLESHALDSFGRSLATVTLPDGRDFATAMIEAGHGTKARV